MLQLRQLPSRRVLQAPEAELPACGCLVVAVARVQVREARVGPDEALRPQTVVGSLELAEVHADVHAAGTAERLLVTRAGSCAEDEVHGGTHTDNGVGAALVVLHTAAEGIFVEVGHAPRVRAVPLEEADPGLAPDGHALVHLRVCLLHARPLPLLWRFQRAGGCRWVHEKAVPPRAADGHAGAQIRKGEARALQGLGHGGQSLQQRREVRQRKAHTAVDDLRRAVFLRGIHKVELLPRAYVRPHCGANILCRVARETKTLEVEELSQLTATCDNVNVL
mmetsp:Transcript_53374/g.155568  ORF Transcript_53374/g.155568 Transcript_53374/m.155568 type:complete len:279 (+) Transcript_53374:108-944(+)